MADIRFWDWEVLTKYPHIFGQDAKLVSEFIETNPGLFAKVAYDVAVGGYSEPPEGISKKLASDWKYLASFKIDMIGFSDDTSTIIEVKYKAGLGAIGQLMAYRYFWEKGGPVEKPTRLALLTMNPVPGILEVCEFYNIEVWSPETKVVS